MKNKILALGLCLSMATISMPAKVSATVIPPKNIEVQNNGGTSTYADTVHYKIIKNKKYISTSKSIISYLTDMWAKSDKYTVTKGVTKTASLSVSATSGSFTAADIKAAGGFNASISKSFSVGISIPADPSKNSKLTIQQEKKKYSCDLYSVIDYGYSKSETKKGSGYVYEPVDLYLVVVYK